MQTAPKTLTTDQLSYMWGLSKKTIAEYAKGEQGWLAPAKVRRGVWDAHTANRLYIENMIIPKYAAKEDGEESYDAARRRKEIANANLKELQEGHLRGDLIEKDRAVEWVVSLVTEAKVALMAMPRRIAPVIYGSTEIRDIENKIRREVTRILDKLARPVKEKKRASSE